MSVAGEGGTQEICGSTAKRVPLKATTGLSPRLSLEQSTGSLSSYATTAKVPDFRLSGENISEDVV